jgi:antitoxin CcdA
VNDLPGSDKAMDLNVSQLCDGQLPETTRVEQEIRWRMEHADFIAAHSATVETEGLPFEAWRAF